MSIRLETTAYGAKPTDRSRMEYNDCSVRALAVAAGISYDEAWERFDRAGRKPKKATPRSVTYTVNAGLGSAAIDTYVHERGKYLTLAQFIKVYPVGRFTLHRRGHAFALVDGIVHDWAHGTGARTRIRCAWRMK